MLQNHIEETKKKIDDLNREHSCYRKKSKSMKNKMFFIFLFLFFVVIPVALYYILILDGSIAGYNRSSNSMDLEFAILVWLWFGWIAFFVFSLYSWKAKVIEGIPDDVRDRYEHKKTVLMDRFLELKKAERLERQGRYEEAARICKDLGLWDEAEQIRKKIE